MAETRRLPTLSISAAYRFTYSRNAYQGSAKVSQLDVAFQGSQGGASVDSSLTAQTNQMIDVAWKNIEVDVVSTGTAHGIVLGLDFKPDENWNVGLRLEWNSHLELENTSSSVSAPDGLLPFLSSYAKGAKSNLTEPVVIAGGVAWKGISNLTLESSWTYGFYQNVDRGGLEAQYHNSLFGGMGARYRLTPLVEASLGYTHDWAFKDNAAREETDFDLPTHFLAAGLQLQATSRLRIDGGIMFGLGQDRTGTSVASGASQKMSSQLIDFALGVQWSPRI